MNGSSDLGDLTRLLVEIRSLDDRAEADRLFAVVYEDLRRTATELMRRERSDHTLRPTALVHEAYLRLIRQDRVQWENRAHFFGIAARAMRQVLVEHARSRAADKRGGGFTRITLGDKLSEGRERVCEMLDLHSALERLSALDGRLARVVEFKVFGGLNTKEIAHLLDVSTRTVEHDWKFARMWLTRELRGAAD
jgi:RNA polymerase sigma factor (TIGR02999 family)